MSASLRLAVAERDVATPLRVQLCTLRDDLLDAIHRAETHRECAALAAVARDMFALGDTLEHYAHHRDEQVTT